MPIAHTARFLQTFHTGQTAAQRTEEAGTDAHTDHRDTDPAAVAFVKTGKAAKFAAPVATSTYSATYRGIEVTHGDGLITEPQAKFVADIALTREGVTPEMLESLKVRLLQGFAKGAASQFISKYKDLPRKSQDAARSEAVSPGPGTTPATSTPLNWDDITDGNYALPYQGKTHFYRVSRKEGKGKWAGRTFVNVQERASDELFKIEDRKRQVAILFSIREFGPAASHLLFSEVMDSCWHCLRSIGDETNPYKPYGLGPVCGPKVMG